LDHEALIDTLASLDDDQVVKAVLTAAARRRLSHSEFAYVDAAGNGHLPINDPEHVRAALARFSQTHFESAAAREHARRKIQAAAKKFGIDLAEDDDVSKADATPAGIFVEITKADVELGVIYGIANVANVIDRQGDVIRPLELRKAAWDFIANHNAANDTHEADMPGKFVESWFEGDEWHVGFRPDDIDVARDAANGGYVGFSIEGAANRVEIAA